MAREKNPTSVTTKKRAPRKSPIAMAIQAAVPAPFTGPEQRAALIAEAAYFRAERRGFAPGHEAEDWLAAESEVDALLLKPASVARV